MSTTRVLRLAGTLVATASTIVMTTARAGTRTLPDGGTDASQRPPQTVTSRSYSSQQVEAGQPLFSAHCGFCHGRDAAGGERGPDLTRSDLVAEDDGGNKIAPVVRSGRVEKGMPAFDLGEAELSAIVAFIHDQKTKTAKLQGNRRTVDDEDLQTGNAEAGERYFNGAGGCSRCHSPSGDLAGIANRLHGLPLLQRMLNPRSGRGGTGVAPKVTVTLPSGEKTAGSLAYHDEFTIALRDSTGWIRSWPTTEVSFTVDNPLDAHAAQLGKYTDEDMHDVLAYLRTLR
jgi:cytochrome c oxidase cbb3-type subunit III